VAGKRLGIITAAIPAYSVLECLDDNGASVDILKLGVTYPLPMQRILDFIRAHDEVLILEELDRVLELEIKSAVLDAGIASCKIRARGPNEQLMREFTPQRVWGLLSEHWPDAFQRRKAREAATEQVVPRLPQMCPGCGHRSAFYAIHKLLYEEYDGKDGRPGPAITVADIGCHTLGSMEPYDMGTVLLCMGHSNGTGAGLSLRNTSRPVVTFIGDSTFYHAGLPAIINAITYNHHMTLVVMENYTTAMTGHQPVHGHGDYGNPPVDIPKTLEDLGCKFVRSVDAYMQGKLTEIMREAIAYPGFSVVIAKHVCMLKFTRERIRKLSKKPVPVGAPN
jgi:indolepyruvate ferredoxin oxidoreductase alpha subunit